MRLILETWRLHNVFRYLAMNKIGSSRNADNHFMILLTSPSSHACVRPIFICSAQRFYRYLFVNDIL